jgi:dTDP-4-dehydrorhamnose 3,5-epimerase
MAKLVRCTRGRVLDVAVDLRLEADSFGKWVAVELSEDNFKQLFIPVGFAHGFVSLSDVAEIQYKCSNYYTPSAERTIRWDDPDLGIQWGISQPLVSPKDRAGISLADYRSNPAFGTTSPTLS